MKKKKWLNSKIIFTITMVFVVCFFILTSLWAAKKIDFHSESQPPIADFSASETKTDYSNVAENPYCTSSGGSQSYEYIAGVAVDVFYNPSGASPYTDFTCLKICLIQGNSASVSLTPGFTGSSYTEYWKIWIDYNGDNDFEDAGEEVFSGSGSSIVSGNFTVPASTIIGDTRMRVSMSYNTYPPVCGSFNYGEVEDYTVNIAADYQAPAADFVGSPTSGQAPLIVNFTDQSINSPTSWSWDFGDGGTSTAQHPVYTYTTEGNYTVTLTVTNAYGSDTMTSLFSVRPAGDPDDPGYTQEDKDAIDDFLMNPDPTFVTIEPDMIGDEGFLNLMVQLTSGMHIALQVDMTNFDISTGTEVEINTSTGTYFAINNDREVVEVPIATVSDYMTAGIENTRYWFSRDDGDATSGPIVKAIMTVKANGSTLDNVLVQLRRDPLEQEGQEPISNPTPSLNRPCAEKLEWTIVISIYSDSCSRSDFCDGYCMVNDVCGECGEVWIDNPDLGVCELACMCNFTFYYFTSSTVGQGSITLYPPGGTYPAGTVVTLTATPDPGWQFDGWSGDLSGMENPTTITMNSDKTVTATFSEIGTTGTVGITDVFGSTSTSANRRAMPFTMPENGTITSVTMFHTGGIGSMILGVYDGEGTPQNRLGVTPTTAVSGSTGWQTINLTSSAFVMGGSTVWLAWVYESNPGIRYQTGSPGRYQSTQTWSGGMPDPFGSGSQTSYIYSIYATYNR